MDERILILAPRGRDGPVIAETLATIDLQTLVCRDLAALTAALHQDAGAAILTEEALAEGAGETLRLWLEAQPSWSDLPFIVLVTKQAGKRTAIAAGRLQAIGNIVLLERPINAETLVSAARSAVRARRRQYQTRDHLAVQTKVEEQLRFALDAGHLGAWELDLESGALKTSATMRAHYGRQPDEELTLVEVEASVHPDDDQRRRQVVEVSKTGGDHNIEYRVVWPDGSVHWVQVRGRLNRRSAGEPARMSGVTLDVTERKHVEDALRRLNESLEDRVARSTQQLQLANRRLRAEIAEREQAQAALVQAQKMEAIGQLTGGIAHDFNNLLTAIVGNIDMIERRSDDPRVQRMAANAREGVERATKLTGQLLAFSRSQQLDLQAVEVDVLIRGMGDLLTRSLGHGVEIRSDLGAAGVRATADLNQLELAILNLSINARDAMEGEGVVTISSRVSDDWREGLRPGRHVVISVADTGHGIEPSLLQRIFDPFFTTKSVGKGTGLGLSQVYGIAAQSGGTVAVESTVGLGTTFEVWLPVSDAAERKTGATTVSSETPLSRGEHVLVVDDDPGVRRFIVQCLQSLGYRVTSADGGKAGLDRLDEDRPDLLVVDFAMPGFNGAQVAALARERSPRLAVLLVTGYADADAIEDLVSAEAVLRKPFKVSDLALAARRALEGAGAQVVTTI